MLYQTIIPSNEQKVKVFPEHTDEQLARKSHTPCASAHLLRARKLLNRRCASAGFRLPNSRF
jgi:hypothetical protein